ncbi:MAG TPA: DUF2784 domain-containing protein [Gemmatimonadales bacterium]|jgi:hypothetical protein|nr:DUF2784 domain-containing protein [Gemmatimonadales bacterium]
MPWGALADAVVTLHFGFVLFVILGGLLVLRWRWAAWLHLPAAAWGTLVEFAGLICPLTPLEKWLRHEGGLAGYHGGFVEHYVLPVLYPSGLTRSVQVVLGTLVVLFNLLVYWLVWRRIRRSSRQS